jgi:hypothetical protein
MQKSAQPNPKPLDMQDNRKHKTHVINVTRR